MYAHLDSDPMHRAAETIGATISAAMGDGKSGAEVSSNSPLVAVMELGTFGQITGMSTRKIVPAVITGGVPFSNGRRTPRRSDR